MIETYSCVDIQRQHFTDKNVPNVHYNDRILCCSNVKSSMEAFVRNPTTYSNFSVNLDGWTSNFIKYRTQWWFSVKLANFQLSYRAAFFQNIFRRLHPAVTVKKLRLCQRRCSSDFDVDFRHLMPTERVTYTLMLRNSKQT